MGMDEVVLKYYRRLLREDFPNAGALDEPSVFVEAVGEKLINCGNTGNYMQLYLHVTELQIVDIKYLCACEPAANVAVEVLCSLVKGKTLDEAGRITEADFQRFLDGGDDPFYKKVLGILELLGEALVRCRAQAGLAEPAGEADAPVHKLSWDGALST